jgi:hypothetical protein
VVARPRRVILTGNRIKNNIAIPWIRVHLELAASVLFAVILKQLRMRDHAKGDHAETGE